MVFKLPSFKFQFAKGKNDGSQKSRAIEIYFIKQRENSSEEVF